MLLLHDRGRGRAHGRKDAITGSTRSWCVSLPRRSPARRSLSPQRDSAGQPVTLLKCVLELHEERSVSERDSDASLNGRAGGAVGRGVQQRLTLRLPRHAPAALDGEERLSARKGAFRVKT